MRPREGLRETPTVDDDPRGSRWTPREGGDRQRSRFRRPAPDDAVDEARPIEEGEDVGDERPRGGSRNQADAFTSQEIRLLERQENKVPTSSTTPARGASTGGGGIPGTGDDESGSTDTVAQPESPTSVDRRRFSTVGVRMSPSETSRTFDSPFRTMARRSELSLVTTVEPIGRIARMAARSSEASTTTREARQAREGRDSVGELLGKSRERGLHHRARPAATAICDHVSHDGRSLTADDGTIGGRYLAGDIDHRRSSRILREEPFTQSTALSPSRRRSPASSSSRGAPHVKPPGRAGERASQSPVLDNVERARRRPSRRPAARRPSPPGRPPVTLPPRRYDDDGCPLVVRPSSRRRRQSRRVGEGATGAGRRRRRRAAVRGRLREFAHPLLLREPADVQHVRRLVGPGLGVGNRTPLGITRTSRPRAPARCGERGRGADDDPRATTSRRASQPHATCQSDVRAPELQDDRLPGRRAQATRSAASARAPRRRPATHVARRARTRAGTAVARAPSTARRAGC